MAVGDVSKPIKKDGIDQVVKLVDAKKSHLKTLEERYGSVERLLQQKKKDEFVAVFEKELKEKATIVYLD